MKKLINLIVAVMLSVFSVGAMAIPGNHTAQKGDTSWGIAKATCGDGSKWKALGLPRRLIAGKTYAVDPDKCTVSAPNTPTRAKVAVKPAQAQAVKVKTCNPCRLPHFNEDAFRKSGRDRLDALAWLGFSLQDAEEVADKYRNGTCEDHAVNPGDEFGQMVGRTRDLIGRIVFTGKKPEKAKKCVAPSGKAVIVPDACENWSTSLEKPTTVPPAPVSEMPPPIEVEVPRYATVVVPDPPKPEPPVAVPVAEPASAALVEERAVVPVTEPGRKTCDRGYELSGGVFAWQNHLAEGRGAYAENMCWNSIEAHPEYAWGYGLYGLVAPGESNVSTYKWDEKRLAFQLGLQGNYLNDEGREEQLLGKIRVGKEWQEASLFSQRNLMLGGYGEWWKYLNAEGDRAGAQFEFWTALDKDAAGGEAQSRTMYQLLGFYDTKLSEDGKWGFRGLSGPAYTKWDKTWWLRVIPEFRYTLDNGALVAFGPYWNAVLDSETYTESAPNTLGLFARVEFGGKFRKDAEIEQQREICQRYEMEHCPVETDAPAESETVSGDTATEGWDVLNLNRQIEAEQNRAPAPPQEESVGEGFSFLP